MKIFKKFLLRQAERKLRKIPGLYRGQARFNIFYPGKYEFGIGSYGLPKVHDWNEGSTLKIGMFCSIASGVEIFLGGNHRHDWISTFPFPAILEDVGFVEGYGCSKGDVLIGDDVWLGANCVILSGVHIGHGAVVGAGAVVTKNVEPYSIVVGNPAKHVKWRFAEEIRNSLTHIAWWNWPVEEIKEQIPLLCSNNVSDLISYAKHRDTVTN